MVSATHFNLVQERMSPCCWQVDERKILVNIDSQKQLSIENISVWEITKGTDKAYRISMPGLAQNNYNNRVMIRGKQTEGHVLGQYAKQKATMSKYPLTNYLSTEECMEYLVMLKSNNITGCIGYLRKKETALNTRPPEKVKVMQ